MDHRRSGTGWSGKRESGIWCYTRMTGGYRGGIKYGARHPDGENGGVQEGRSLDQPEKDEDSGIHPWIHLG